MSKSGRKLNEEEIKRRIEKRKKRKRRRVWFLILEILILTALLGIGYMMKKYDKFQVRTFVDGEIKTNEGVQLEGYNTIALFGGDSREGALEEGTHADTIMIAVINNDTKEVRMVSLYRDTLTEQEDGELKKANNAYFVGGPKDAINMLNRNYDIAIEDYVTVDFKALSDTIDLLGGIEVDVTEAEAEEMNNYIQETATVTGKKANFIQKPGVQTLDGVQATTYARIRKNVGGDYKRTERQRIVIQKVAEKAKQTKISTINKIIDTVFPQVSTSFSIKELIGLASNVMRYTLGETSGFPFELTDGNIEGVGSSVIPLGLVENVEELHQFLYPEEEYNVSDKVQEIAYKIENLTGYTRDDYIPPKTEEISIEENVE